MKQFTYLIGDENGMHARPAGKLATYAKRFVSDVSVSANGKKADGKTRTNRPYRRSTAHAWCLCALMARAQLTYQ